MKSKIHEHNSSNIIAAGKKLFLVVAFIATAFVQQGFAQLVPPQREDSTKANQLSALLNSYYGIKNALVNSDATVAAAKANELVKAIDAVDMKTLSTTDHNAFMAAQDNLKTDAQTIAASNKIEAQRTAFSTLSNNIYTLAKAAKLSTEPVYQEYCPMKKMYWLSSEAAIKNPYYGKAMFTCGKVTETIN
ncbi:MAG: DUF3347 domain-containing protein [Panacibacter sp.]